ncbi:MAG: zinc-ribbon domain-containing protein [Oscillospiraceae bacterium]|nr:zinc-ribbon domain-containing protein [Oscillospiraceae bacterium]
MNKNNLTSTQANNLLQPTSPVEQANSAVNQIPLMNEQKKFCQKCGAEISNDTRFCQSCGTEVNVNAGTIPLQMSNVNPEAQDTENNKAMAAISYLGVLALIPLFAAKESPFARFHCNQGLILLIANVALAILKQVNSSLIYSISSILGGIVGIGFNSVSICIWVFAMRGLIAALKGEKKELPLIGGLKILK